jgi:hypothetical protein
MNPEFHSGPMNPEANPENISLEAGKEAETRKHIQIIRAIGDDLSKMIKEYSNSGVDKFEARRPVAAKLFREQLINKYPDYQIYVAALTDYFQTGSEWQLLTVHLLIDHKDEPKVMDAFWETLRGCATLVQSKKALAPLKRGVVIHAAAAQIFDKLGYKIRLATPTEDMSNELREGCDLFAGDIPVQVKSKVDMTEPKLIRYPYLGSNNGLKITMGYNEMNTSTGAPSEKLVDEIKFKLDNLEK